MTFWSELSKVIATFYFKILYSHQRLKKKNSFVHFINHILCWYMRKSEKGKVTFYYSCLYTQWFVVNTFLSHIHCKSFRKICQLYVMNYVATKKGELTTLNGK